MATEFQFLLARLRAELAMARNLSRQDDAQKVIDLYNGQHYDYVLEELQTIFKSWKDLKLQIAIDNVTRSVVDKLSNVIDSAPVFTCDDAAVQDVINEVMADGMLKVALKKWECYSNAVELAALHPVWDDARKGFKFRVFHQGQLFVAQKDEDPEEADAIIYRREWYDSINKRDVIDYVNWSDEYAFIFDQNGTERSANPETNPDMVNPYGMIPFAFLRAQLPEGSFFPEVSEELTTAQIEIDLLLTYINQLCRLQSFGVPVAENWQGNGEIIIDPSLVLKIPAPIAGEPGGKFSFVTPPNTLPQLLEVLKDKLSRLLVRYGLPPSAFRLGGTASSGYARKLENFDLKRHRIDAIPLMTYALRDLWRIILRMYNVHNGTNVAENALIMIDYPEPEYEDDPTSAATKVDIMMKKIKAGVASPIDWAKQENPDLDDDAAEAFVTENLQRMQTLTRRFPNLAAIIGGTTTQNDGGANNGGI